MNRLHPIFGIAFLVTGAALLVKSLSGLTKEKEAPRAITHDISATPVAVAPQVAEPAPAANGTATAA